MLSYLLGSYCYQQDNILINHDGKPMLTDFGISRIVQEGLTITRTSTLKGNVRWMAIELVNPSAFAEATQKHEFQTFASDVWAYGMVVFVSKKILR